MKNRLAENPGWPEGGGLFTVKEVAGRLKCSESTVRKLFKCGILPGELVGSKLVRLFGWGQ